MAGFRNERRKSHWLPPHALRLCSGSPDPRVLIMLSALITPHASRRPQNRFTRILATALREFGAAKNLSPRMRSPMRHLLVGAPHSGTPQVALLEPHSRLDWYCAHSPFAIRC